MLNVCVCCIGKLQPIIARVILALQRFQEFTFERLGVIVVRFARCFPTPLAGLGIFVIEVPVTTPLVTSTLLYEAELEGGASVPLPANLVWLPHESTWKQVVEGRTRFGLKTFSLNLQYAEDYGVNLGLKAEIEGARLDLGGDF